jgi:ParB family chromosome partitioning protein
MSAKKKTKHKKPAVPSAKQTPAAPAAKHPRPGLGRGLGALIGNTAHGGDAVRHTLPTVTHGEDAVRHLSASLANAIIEVPVAEIQRSPWQPRHVFNEDALRELAESIKANGVIQPLICRKNSDGRYELIAGERRLRAAIEAQLAKVPVILKDAEDRRAAEMAIIENIQRQDLNVIEEAEGYRTLAESFSLTQQDVADRVGKARASIANALRLLDLPDEVKQLLSGGQLSTGHAKVLLGLADETEQTILGRKCVTEDLTVRSLEKLIQRRKAAPTDPRKGTPDMPDSYVRDLTDHMHRHFGTAVRLTPGVTHANGKHTKGMIEIDFYDNDDLDRLLNIFGIKVD